MQAPALREANFRPQWTEVRPRSAPAGASNCLGAARRQLLPRLSSNRPDGWPPVRLKETPDLMPLMPITETAGPLPPTRWGLVGPGQMAQKFAGALLGVPGATLVAVAARDPGRAQAFVQAWCPPRTPTRIHPNVAALATDPDVDAVYVATPHNAHFEAVQTCLLAGKPVLCEKPLTPTAAQAHALVTLARKRKVFLMEALWTRFLPAWVQVLRWLVDGAIGSVHTLQSSVCFRSGAPPEHRQFNPALAGGALLDVGVFALAMSQGVMATQGRHEVPRFHVTGRRGPTGVDVRVHATLDYGEDRLSQFVCGFDGEADNGMRIHGERGCIELPSGFWMAQSAALRRTGREPEAASLPFRINGFEYEIEEAMRCIGAGRIESAAMPHEHTLGTLRLVDAMRLQLGVRYPFE
jgi:predicted dehydrogenase